MDRAWVALADIELFGRGSISGARAILERWPSPEAAGFLTVLRAERDWAQYLAVVEALPSDIGPHLFMGQAHTELGNELEAREAFEMVEKLIPKDFDLDSVPVLKFSLGYALAELGRADEANQIADTLLPTNVNDRYESPKTRHWQALIYARSGRSERAIDLLEELLDTPYYGEVFADFPVTRHGLRLDPLWDPLRGNPRFEKLVAD
jgi:tetratricopeptide (TPR) repeat protein